MPIGIRVGFLKPERDFGPPPAHAVRARGTQDADDSRERIRFPPPQIRIVKALKSGDAE